MNRPMAESGYWCGRHVHAGTPALLPSPPPTGASGVGWVSLVAKGPFARALFAGEWVRQIWMYSARMIAAAAIGNRWMIWMYSARMIAAAANDNHWKKCRMR